MPIKGKYLYLLASHYLNATRIDVLHSPFVFSLYNHCIKREGTYGYGHLPLIYRRKLYTISKLSKYFNFTTIMEIGRPMEYPIMKPDYENDDIKHYRHYDGPLKITPDVIKKIDYIFIREVLLPFINAKDIVQLMHNNSIVFIDNIYENESTIANWKQLCDSNEFTVSIDFFFFGILSKRKEQVKEHFKLRLV